LVMDLALYIVLRVAYVPALVDVDQA